MRFVGPECIETRLAQRALAATRTPGVVFGGPFAADFDALVTAASRRELLGLWGLTFTEHLVVSLDASYREKIGWFLQLAPSARRFVADALSVEWALHFGLANTQARAHPGWLVPRGDAFDVLANVEGYDGRCLVARNDVGIAMLAAVLQIPCVYLATHGWGYTSSVAYNPLVRWHSLYHETGVLVFDPEEVAAASARATVCPREVVDLACGQARETLALFQADAEDRMKPDYSVLQQLGGVASPRELPLGSVFDPATHYTDEYYGDGAGLLFVQPDGSKSVYHGPAHSWDGFEVALDILDVVLSLGGKKLLDVGCGSGDFVRRACSRGVDAWGIDISQAAHDRAAPEIKDRIIVGDFTRSSSAVGQFDVVTALDFMEHIFVSDLPGLIDGLGRLLALGGRLFLVICTRAAAERDWTIQRGDVFTQENSWLLCSGHVTIRRWPWWLRLFHERGFTLDSDATALFGVLKDEHVGFRNVESWGPRNVMVLRGPKG